MSDELSAIIGQPTEPVGAAGGAAAPFLEAATPSSMDVGDDAPKAAAPLNTGSGEPLPLGAPLEVTAPITAADASSAAIAHAPAGLGRSSPPSDVQIAQDARTAAVPAGVLPSGDAAAMPSASHHPPAPPVPVRPSEAPAPAPPQRAPRLGGSSNASADTGDPPSCGTGSSAAGGASNSGGAKSKRVNGLRRGKWTPEEEAYALRLIAEFKAGLLPLTDGTTLRTFLSKLLHCDPMRISKKFVGSNCIGKQVFRRRQADMDRLTPEQVCRPSRFRRVICRHA